MSYENAPATKMLATRCAACGRPLVDAKSVEIGMGPDCRKRLGYDADVSEEARAEANKLVHHVAMDQTGFAVAIAAERLRAIGFQALADRIEKRACPIHIEVENDSLNVRAPYCEEAVGEWHRVGRWDKASKTRVVPANRKAALWALLRRFYAGECGVGPKGAFEVTS